MAVKKEEQKISQLRAELQAAERDLSAKKTAKSELAEANVEIVELERLARINGLRLKEAVRGFDAATFDLDRTYPGPYYEKRDAARLRVETIRESVRVLEEERADLDMKLSLARSGRDLICKKILEFPAYKQAREKQRRIVADAVKLARTLFSAPFDELGGIVDRLRAFSAEEKDMLDSVRVALRVAGLPEVEPCLTWFAARVSPSFVEQIKFERDHSLREIEMVVELASREGVQ